MRHICSSTSSDAVLAVIPHSKQLTVLRGQDQDNGLLDFIL
jgi:hypothetical protein